MIRKEGQLFGRYSLRVANAAGDGDHGGNVDPKWTIHRTALAHSALQPCDFVAFFQKGAVHFALAPNHFTQCASEFIGRTQAGISIIADIHKAAFRTQPAAGANAYPASNAGAIIGIQYLTHPFDIYGRIRSIFKLKFLLITFQFISIPLYSYPERTSGIECGSGFQPRQLISRLEAAPTEGLSIMELGLSR
jgi:hypothetical protein